MLQTSSFCDHSLIFSNFPRNRHICLWAHIKKKGGQIIWGGTVTTEKRVAWDNSSNVNPMDILKNVTKEATRGGDADGGGESNLVEIEPEAY